jgi:two-component system OmpR family response regulator
MTGAAVAPEGARVGADRASRNGNVSPGRHVSAGTRIRVLVVDDEPAICRALSIALTRAGCATVVAESGDAALALLRAERVDAMVLDLRIPDMRGDAVFHLATALQPHLRRQTMFITGDVTDRADQLVRACGAPYVRKPFTLADITDTVRALVPVERRETA